MKLKDRIKAKRQEQGEKDSREGTIQPAGDDERLLKDIYTLAKEISAKIEKYEQERSKNNGNNND